MQVHQCRFVLASDLFAGCPMAMNAFANGDPDCSWGDNNRTMVTEDVIRRLLEDVVDIPESDEPLDDEPLDDEQQQTKLVLERLKNIPDDCYIDLEN